MEDEKDELIQAQKEVIGVLFEIIKRLQANNGLDEEYIQLVSNVKKRDFNKKRLDEILKEREENAKIVTKLLEKLEI